MFVPTMIKDKFIKEDGGLSQPATELMENLLQNMQQSLSNEGYVIPPVSSDPDSVTPPAAGGQLAQIQNGINEAGVQIAMKGTLIFDPYEINGGSPSVRNGQLKVLLGDGLFHPITNS